MDNYRSPVQFKNVSFDFRLSLKFDLRLNSEFNRTMHGRMFTEQLIHLCKKLLFFCMTTTWWAYDSPYCYSYHTHLQWDISFPCNSGYAVQPTAGFLSLENRKSDVCIVSLKEYVFKEWKQETRMNSGGEIGSQSSAEQLEQIQPERVNECVSDLRYCLHVLSPRLMN